MAKYSLLKGTISHLQIKDDPKELRADNIGLLAMIGLMIVGAFELIGVLIGSLTSGSITLEGKSFQCYVGRKKVQGKLEHISFKDGDYVEMVVEQIDDNHYQSYAARMPQYHALYFPRSVGVTTFQLLKYCSIFISVIGVLSYLLSLLSIFSVSKSFEEFFDLLIIGCCVSFFLILLFFFLVGGRYTFISNRIYSALGYPKPWLHNSSKEHARFKKLNRSGDPELYDDPQTPEFERIKKLDPYANYYCRTPILPNWVKVIDERGFTPNESKQSTRKVAPIKIKIM
ncbi:hypothetical protein [Gilliamella sp. Bif1-4]|uniref:hypothetical protein n=1 Tax=Gilliamella sp. Bif1-4 TaxID=3120233 RepID=UPI00080DA03B|nr:hypothetical protein [Gilliamella apicola]OCG39094.1 hypothetical protein A9G25_11565 [Gilliamella apicola]